MSVLTATGVTAAPPPVIPARCTAGAGEDDPIFDTGCLLDEGTHRLHLDRFGERWADGDTERHTPDSQDRATIDEFAAALAQPTKHLQAIALLRMGNSLEEVAALERHDAGACAECAVSSEHGD